MTPQSYLCYQIIYLLQTTGDAFTADEIAEELKAHPRTVRKHMNELYALDIVHHAEWEPSGKKLLPVYRYGAGRDKTRPSRSNVARRCARYATRKREALKRCGGDQ
jgi:predicted ArsR family transcriptional regulator